MLEFLAQGALFLLSAFIVLTIISLVQVGWQFLREWNENR